MTDLKPYVLRYWESEFKELSPEKDANDQRRYRQADIEVVRTIQRLLHEERFTIAGARKRLREELRRERKDAAPASPRRRRRVASPRQRETLRHLRGEVHELLTMLSA